MGICRINTNETQAAQAFLVHRDFVKCVALKYAPWPKVHVFKGEIEMHSPATAMQELKEGQALSFADARTPTPMAADPVGFATLGELDARTADS